MNVFDKAMVKNRRRKSENRPFSASVSKDEYNTLSEYLRMSNFKNMSAFVRAALIEYLKNHPIPDEKDGELFKGAE